MRSLATSEASLIFHAEHFDVAHQRGMPLVGVAQHLAANPAMADFDQGRRPGPADRAHEFDSKIVGNLDGVDQDILAFFQSGGVADEEGGQFCVTRISHDGGAGN
jgi:hypothetical protein